MINWDTDQRHLSLPNFSRGSYPSLIPNTGNVHVNAGGGLERRTSEFVTTKCVAPQAKLPTRNKIPPNCHTNQINK